MALIQLFLTWIGRSAGKVLNAIFGWAVRALFGQTSPREEILLSALVGAAVAWPLLLLGVAVPRLAAFALAFVPLPKSIPAWIIRIVWVGLALLVPLAVGATVAARSTGPLREKPWFRRLLAGFPITVGLAAAFLFMFFTIPFMKLMALARRQTSADVPLATKGDDAYTQTATTLMAALNEKGFALQRFEPSWWVVAPKNILRTVGGEAFRTYLPGEAAFYRSAKLEMSFYPSGVLLRGQSHAVVWAQGLIAEASLSCNARETTSPKATALEDEIRRLWRTLGRSPRAHVGAAPLQARVAELARALGQQELDLDEWRVLYRQLLQLSRGLAGEPPLLQSVALEKGKVMDEVEMEGIDDTDVEPEHVTADPKSPRATTPPPLPPEVLSTGKLVKEAMGEMTTLAKKELALAKAELRADLVAELSTVKGLGVALLGALLAVNALVVAAVLALTNVLPGWAAGLIVAAVLLAATAGFAVMAWRKRLRNPLSHTRRSLRDDLTRLKEWTA